MARSKRKRGSSKEAYRSIRKPVPPPTRVERDRRRKIKEELTKREAEEDAQKRDGVP